MKKTLFTMGLALLTALLLPGAALAESRFVDVPETSWCYWEVEHVVENGMMNPTGENTFGPDEPLTRAMAVYLLYRGEGAPAVERVEFEDVWANVTEIAGGYSETRFAPDDSITRQQFAVLLYRLAKQKGHGFDGEYPTALNAPDAAQVSAYANEAVCWMVRRGFMTGDNTPINPQGQVTRAQAASMAVHFYNFLQDGTEYEVEGLYLGIEGYGQEDVNEWTKNNFRYRFFVNGSERRYFMDNGLADEEGRYAYDLQNCLQEGKLYHLTVQYGKIMNLELMDASYGTVEAVSGESITVNGTAFTLPAGYGVWRVSNRAGGSSVAAAQVKEGDTVYIATQGGGGVYIVPASRGYTPPVSGTPGLQTLKNFLQTCLMPVGVTLYQYGGGWNWQITGSSNLTTTLGVPHEWVDFFRSQDASYTYKDPGGNANRRNTAGSYYPFGGYSEYYYAGADCAGYVGWALYNTLNTEGDGDGYMQSAMAWTLSNWGWGSWSQATPTGTGDAALRPGDVVGISGHIYIALGTCADGSAIILHSTPTNSRSGNPGGGVQMSAIGKSKTCDAYKLATRYMSTYYPTWYERYEVDLKNPNSYYSFNAETRGRFRWDVSGEQGGLTDPDGYQKMSASEVLSALFDK